MKVKKIIYALLLHCIFSAVLFGAVRVYQTGYNTMHREKICMASIDMNAQQGDIQILNYRIPVCLPSEQSVLYLVGYFLTDAPVHDWLYFASFIFSS